MQETLADRMKAYEAQETSRKLDSSQPVIARLDGRKFSKFLRRFETPFDARFTDAMTDTCKALVEETRALFGYVQTDEISLVWHLAEDADPDHHLLFDGRIQKMCSVLSGLASASLISALLARMPESERAGILEARPHFDARVWTVPDQTEAANYILWRRFECEKNAISAFARNYVSFEELQGLGGEQQLELATENGATDFYEVRDEDRFGRYCRKIAVERRLSEGGRMQIPVAHRPEAGHVVARSELSVGPLTSRNLKEVFNLIFG